MSDAGDQMTSLLTSDLPHLRPMSDLAHLQFWAAALQVVWINILLSGDNAVVIAMACRGLQPRQRRWGMIIGAGVASVLLITFSSVVTAVMGLPYARMLAAGALLWIAAGLLGPMPADQGQRASAAKNLRRAVRTIVLADVIMSLDNAIAVAAVARGRYALIGLGLAISIPIVYGGSRIVLALIGRYPIIVWAGGALLGFVAGELLADDPALSPWLRALVDGSIGSALPGAARHFQHQIGLDLTESIL